MRSSIRSWLLAPALLLLASGLTLHGQASFTAETMMRLARISEPTLSLDGATVAFTVQRIDVPGNTKPTQIYTIPLAGGTPTQITFAGEQNGSPRWSPDSRTIYFISNRGGSSQIWAMSPDGSDARQITNLATEAGGVLPTPDGTRLLFTSQVYPECGADDACNQRRIGEEESSKIQARIYDTLLYRHWNEWRGNRRQHLMIINTDGGGLIDLTPGSWDVPPFSLGGGLGYDVSPDSLEVAFVMNRDSDAASSTNSDIYVVSTDGGDILKITTGEGADAGPKYSPDGRSLAFASQERAGYESDRVRLMVLNRTTGETRDLTAQLDRWVGEFTWSPDSSRLFYTVEDRGRTGLQMIQATGGGTRNIISGSASVSDVQFTRDGRTMIYSEVSGSRPTELYRATSSGGPAVALTHLNDEILANTQLTPLEEISVPSADGTPIATFIVRPPNFDENRRYPLLLLIHGGPQGAWGESWSYRWNAQVFAAAGYVVAMPNPRGSTGYGQQFIEEITQDWGGLAYQDLMAVTDHMAFLPYVDEDRMVAAGGSYGGYMVDWMLGHTNRFRAFVTHAGVFDLPSMARETEELWFVKWEFGGMPWENPDLYAKWSPSNFVENFQTPTLVIHGEQDYRVPFGQGLQLFTALQEHDVPSRLLVFPDEGHWIQKPQNALLWYSQFLSWLDEWVNRM